MEESEVPLEQTQENIHEAAHHARENWISKVALYSALLAAITAVASLMAGHHSNEAMIAQIKASDNWSYYQAKGIKAAVLANKTEILSGLGHEQKDKDLDKLEAYKKDQENLLEKAKEQEADSEFHLRVHQILARSVTLFQVAIAVAAVSVLTRRRRYWLVSIGFGLVGLAFFLQGLLTK